MLIEIQKMKDEWMKQIVLLQRFKEESTDLPTNAIIESVIKQLVNSVNWIGLLLKEETEKDFYCPNVSKCIKQCELCKEVDRKWDEGK